MLSDGPALPFTPSGPGFFYDAAILSTPLSLSSVSVERGTGCVTVSADDFPAISTIFGQIVEDKQRFERLQVSKEFAKRIFAYNRLKQGHLLLTVMLSVCLFVCLRFG